MTTRFLTGLTPLDSVIGGIEPGKLWVHGSYVGEMKTAFAMNFAYNVAVTQGLPTLYLSWDASWTHLRDSFCALHTAHPKWGGRKPLDVRGLIRKDLEKGETDFFMDVLRDPALFANLHLWSSDGEVPSMSTIADMAREQKAAFVIIDSAHALLTGDEDLMSILKGTRKICQAGATTLLLWQLTRRGRDHATKTGEYRPEAFSGESTGDEVMSEADVVTTSLVDREAHLDGIVRLNCMRVRNGEIPRPFVARFSPSRRLSA